MEKVTIKFAAPHDGNKVGDTAEYEVSEAKRLVKAGVATYATKTAAKAVGADPETAATARG